ncbi:ATP-binding protein [Lebetimonas sp. JH369]|uniref:ATP-binding protein n=1 Tax=Lebetimonas sp. JH369 TaxID=990069 RepID=UPI0004677C62|nr:ATP-binding protein [Lebetimonas sp. JH369]
MKRSRNVKEAFSLIKKFLEESGDNSDYVRSFLSIDLTKPDNNDDNNSIKTRYDRKIAAYKCMLYKAGFKPYKNKIKFPGKEKINELVKPNSPINPYKEISYEEACIWFEEAWKNYNKWEFFSNYKKKEGKEYFDEDIQSILRMLTKINKPGSNNSISGFLKIRPMAKYHTNTLKESFELEILKNLRKGKIVIIDLSQGDEEIQKVYSERICEYIFNDSMKRFTELKPNNFIQFYFEEAHNLFPKKEDKDLTQIYNRIAKEGAKLNLGMIYATQEVSSISSNILKNTQNWFIAHLNNEDELKEIKKFYDFEDFLNSLKKFSVDTDKGFVRMKLLSNPFVIPVQIDKFKKENQNGL